MPPPDDDASGPPPTPLPALRANDPDHAGVEVDNTPSPAAPTTDPHRITFVVPTTDETVFSLGMGSSAAGRNKDTGITGRTKSHVHFHATEEPQTMMALGGPSVDIAQTWVGHSGANLGANGGFIVETQGKSWVEADEHTYTIARTGNSVLRAAGGETSRVAIQADGGDVDIVAKKGILTSAPAIVLAAPAAVTPNPAIAYGYEWEGEVPETHAGEWGARAGALAAIVNAAHELFAGTAKTWHHLRGGTRDEKIEGALGAVKLAAELGEMIHAGMEMVATFHEAKPEGGVVKIGADKSVSLLSGSTAEMAASIAVSISSGVWTTIAAGVSASLKAVGFVAMSGGVASVTGLKKVEIAAEHGEVDIEASKGISIQAEGADLDLASHHNVHVHSKMLVSLGGKTGVKLASGDGSGMGLSVTPDTIGMGTFTSAQALLSAKYEERVGILMSSGAAQSLVAKCKSCTVTLDGAKNHLELYAETMKLSTMSGYIQAGNGKVLLDV